MTPSSEAGFTLPELLVSITILAIIVGALGQALFVGLKTTGATGATLLEARDAQALSASLQADVKGADAIGTSGGPDCAPSPLSDPAPGRVLWTRAAGEAAGAATVAAYFVVRLGGDAAEGTSDRSELRRLRCAITTNPDGTEVSTAAPGPGTVLARWAGLTGDAEIRCDDRAAGECGAQAPLRSDLSAAGATLELNGAAGFPAAGPEYTVVAGEEAMTVTGGFATENLAVERSSGVAHAAGDPVRWMPSLVAITVPQGTAEGATEFRLSVSRRPQLVSPR